MDSLLGVANKALFNLNCFMSGNPGQNKQSASWTVWVKSLSQTAVETVGPSCTVIEAKNRFGRMFEQLIKLHSRCWGCKGDAPEIARDFVTECIWKEGWATVSYDSQQLSHWLR